ncbi:MAG: NAD(P)-dependent glycerol-3-phosphate dehydrogenase [Planctomycetes bacterium]|jgi:glycerol-3-phosphate dehydrogenase (NAD(P)+)|nr:NAD(P)-dependent glycerol-3-phosphate dehydrogenase [Planctomycetota bacterium]
MTTKTLRIGVIGDGGWGTAAAVLLARNGHSVRLYGVFPDYIEEMRKTRVNRKFLPKTKIPPEVELVSDLGALVEGADLLVQAVPTKFLREVAGALAPVHPRGLPVVSLTKGIEIGTHLRPTQILREALGARTPLAALSGPSLADEVAAGVPTSVVVASSSDALARRTQAAFSGPTFRAYASDDLVGVELGGALKNVIAVGAGIADGLGFADNTKAALLTRGQTEMARLGTALGGKRKTFYGLSGIGDLIVTAMSPRGRNRTVGERIGKGQKLPDILASMDMVAEGVTTAKAVKELATRHGIEMPISEEVYKVLYEGKDPRAGVVALMTRSLKKE